jgi:hypothetical protein
VLADSPAPVLAQHEELAEVVGLAVTEVGLVAGDVREAGDAAVHPYEVDVIVGPPDRGGVERLVESAGVEVDATVLAEVVLVELQQPVEDGRVRRGGRVQRDVHDRQHTAAEGRRRAHPIG